MIVFPDISTTKSIPSCLYIFATSSDGPIIREVPVSAKAITFVAIIEFRIEMLDMF